MIFSGGVTQQGAHKTNEVRDENNDFYRLFEVRAFPQPIEPKWKEKNQKQNHFPVMIIPIGAAVDAVWMGLRAVFMLFGYLTSQAFNLVPCPGISRVECTHIQGIRAADVVVYLKALITQKMGALGSPEG